MYYYLIALILTIFTEEFTAIFFRQDRLFYFSVVLVNLVTHTSLNFALFVWGNLFAYEIQLLFIIILEILIVFVEYLLLAYTGYRGANIFLFAFMANAFSFLLGLILVKAGLFPGEYLFD